MWGAAAARLNHASHSASRLCAVPRPRASLGARAGTLVTRRLLPNTHRGRHPSEPEAGDSGDGHAGESCPPGPCRSSSTLLSGCCAQKCHLHPTPVLGSCGCTPGAAYLQHVPNLTHHGDMPQTAITTSPRQDGSFRYSRIPPQRGQTAWGTPSCPMSHVPTPGLGSRQLSSPDGISMLMQSLAGSGLGVPSAPQFAASRGDAQPCLALHPAPSGLLHPHPSPKPHSGEESKGGQGGQDLGRAKETETQHGKCQETTVLASAPSAC